LGRKTQTPLWHIKHWPSWLFIGLAHIIVMLPKPLIKSLSNGLAHLLYKIAKRRRHITETNIKHCYKDLSEEEQQRLVYQIFQENTYGFFEALISWLSPHLKPNIELHNKHVLDAAYAKNKGVLMLSAHFTHIDICGRHLGFHQPINVLYRPQNNPVINYVMERGRERYLESPAINQHNLRGMVNCLKQGRLLWFPFDQDHGVKSSVFAPFFGIPAATLTVPSRLKKLSDCEVVFSYQYRDDQDHYHIDFEALPNFNGKNFEEDNTLLNEHLERVLRQHPAQYMWVHRRFKSRPEGENSLY